MLKRNQPTGVALSDQLDAARERFEADVTDVLALAAERQDAVLARLAELESESFDLGVAQARGRSMLAEATNA